MIYLSTFIITGIISFGLIYLLGLVKSLVVVISLYILVLILEPKLKSITYNKRNKEVINYMYERNYDNLEWIVNYYISKNSYPYIGKDKCLNLKKVLDLKKEDDFKDRVKKIDLEYVHINLETVRNSLLKRMKYKKAEIGKFDFFNEIDKGYKNFKEDNIKLLELDKWLVRQVVGADIKTYGIVSNSDLYELKILLN